jgi:hypothetical protein
MVLLHGKGNEDVRKRCKRVMGCKGNDSHADVTN